MACGKCRLDLCELSEPGNRRRLRGKNVCREASTRKGARWARLAPTKFCVSFPHLVLAPLCDLLVAKHSLHKLISWWKTMLTPAKCLDFSKGSYRFPPHPPVSKGGGTSTPSGTSGELCGWLAPAGCTNPAHLSQRSGRSMHRRGAHICRTNIGQCHHSLIFSHRESCLIVLGSIASFITVS